MTQDTNTASGTAIDRALDAFEERQRGIPQAHMAAALVAEIRAALASAAAPAEDPLGWRRRALEAEATVLNFVREVNGPTFMGEPAESDDALMAREMYESQDDSLLLCASDLQHSAIYDNHVEMQLCMRAVAARIAALVHVAPKAEPAAPAAVETDPCPGCIPGGYCRTPKCGRLIAMNAAKNAAPAAVAHQGVVAWPVMLPSKGQSPVLFDDGYAEGWTKCLEACRAALATAPTTQPAPQQEAQEPVAWQSRTRPTWGGNDRPWSPWESCTKGLAEDCWKTPLLHDWAYEARALYTAPHPSPAAQGDGEKEQDAAFEAVRQKLCKLPRFSFHSDGYGAVRRVSDKSGSWIAFDAAHALFDPVAVDAARAAQEGK